jgi:hypothetical protein
VYDVLPAAHGRSGWRRRSPAKLRMAAQLLVVVVINVVLTTEAFVPKKKGSQNGCLK